MKKNKRNILALGFPEPISSPRGPGGAVPIKKNEKNVSERS